MADLTNVVESKVSECYDIDLPDATYTVTVEGSGDDTKLVAVHDSRDPAPIIRSLPRIPNFMENPELLYDMLLNDTEVMDAPATPNESDLVVAAGDAVPAVKPGTIIYDTDGNIFVLAYKTDSAERYFPALALTYIDPRFAAKIFITFARQSTKDILTLNSRIADNGTRLRNITRELADTKRQAQAVEVATQNAYQSLDACASYYKGKSELHQRQARVLYQTLAQFASEESWTGDENGPKNKLTSSVDGYAVAGVALNDVCVAELAEQILAESRR